MADVFLAVTEGSTGINFNKLVVLKKLRAHLVGDPDFVGMFMDEARLAARLNHPNVVQTLEVERVDDELILAMEYLDGQPLHRLLARTRETIPIAMHLGILHDVLSGIEYAHELRDFDGSALKVVHRDVTPQNIFITYDGQVKVVDFGIAKAEGRESQTKHGIVKGKLTYMSPEQARAELIDRRADIFAVGVMLYEAIARKRMWAGAGEQDIVRALIRGRIPDIAAVVPSVDSMMRNILSRALAATPAERFQTALEFQVALEEYQDALAPRPSTRQLGKMLSDLFADRRKVTREVIESQLVDLKSSRMNMVALPVQDIPVTLEPMAAEATQILHSNPPARSSMSAIRTDSAPLSPPLASSPPQAQAQAAVTPASRGALVALAFVVIAVCSFGAFWLTRRTSLQDSRIHISLRAVPDSVHFSIDGGNKLSNPYNGDAPRDTKEHVIQASADGYEDKKLTVKFDDDLSMTFTLAKRP
jgi:eukaryotic-like serine/threonine-protein kinase